MSEPGQTPGDSVSTDGPHGLVDHARRDLHRFSDSYGVVFLLIVATLLATALLDDFRWGRLITALLMGATFVLTMHASRVPGARRGPAMIVTVVTLLVAACVAAALGDAAVNQMISLAIAAVFVIAASAAIVRRLRVQTSITMRTVMGALCVYLFIGLFFAVVYSAVDLAEGDAFFAQTETPDGVDFIYYSFITQATVGYGDLSPVTDVGRMLAITQALLGQVYLVTIVAALVSNLGRVRSADGRIVGVHDGAQRPEGAAAPGAAPGGPEGRPDDRA
jgi:uncharacterized membrane protein